MLSLILILLLALVVILAGALAFVIVRGAGGNMEGHSYHFALLFSPLIDQTQT